MDTSEDCEYKKLKNWEMWSVMFHKMYKEKAKLLKLNQTLCTGMARTSYKQNKFVARFARNNILVAQQPD